MKEIKKVLLSMLMATPFLAVNTVDAQRESDNCSDAYQKYYKVYKFERKTEGTTYDKSFPFWKEAYDAGCVSRKYKKNIFKHGLSMAIAKYSVDSTNLELKQLILDLYDKRVEVTPSSAITYKSAKLSNGYSLGFLSAEEINTLGESLLKAENTIGVSPSAAGSYFLNKKDMYTAKTIGFGDLYEAYNLVNKVVSDNMDASTVKYSQLKIKADSLGQPLNKKEAKDTLRLPAKIESYGLLTDAFYNDLKGEFNCENLAFLFDKDYESKKEDINWLAGVSNALEESECAEDNLFAQKVTNRIGELLPKQQQVATTSSTGGTVKKRSISSLRTGLLAFKARKYSSAITSLKKAIQEETSGAKKGQAAYYVAYSLFNQKRYAEARTYALKAANYRKGWGDPYMLIGSMYGNSANSCGKTQFDKRAAYWAAGDMYRKAARVDSRKRSKALSLARRYEGAAPDNKLIFTAGKTKGASHRVGGWIGHTTKIR